MCLHDHSGTRAARRAHPPQRARRGRRAGGLAGVAAAAPAVAALGRSGSHGRRGRPPVPAPLVVEGGTLLDPLTGARGRRTPSSSWRTGAVLAAGTRDATRRAVAAVRSGAQRIDAAGAWVLPGLVDSHVHVNALADAAAVLQAGATTARSGSSNFYQDVAMRPLAEWAPGPCRDARGRRLRVAASWATRCSPTRSWRRSPHCPTASSRPSDLRYLTRVNISRGVDVVKTRANPAPASPSRTRPSWSMTRSRSRRSSRPPAGRGVLCHAYSEAGIDGAVRAGVPQHRARRLRRRANARADGRARHLLHADDGRDHRHGPSPDPILASAGAQYTPDPAGGGP